ncbi:MAG TPA: cell division protein ZapA, partial [Pseudomonadales bacterium]|nr:cell division protein ZapA [Pseudomonadales bacterium]
MKVKILDREFQVACPEDEVDELNASAQELDKRMRTTQSSANIVG